MSPARFSHCGPEGSEGNRILMLLHMSRTLASAGWEAQLRKKREALHLMLLLFSGSFGFHAEEKLTAPLKWLCDALAKNKQKTPHLYLMLTVYSQRLLLGAGTPLQSVEGGRKSLPFPLEMIQSTGSNLSKC